MAPLFASMRLNIARKLQVVSLDGWFILRHQISQYLAGATRHGPTQGAMPGIEPYVWQSRICLSDDRRTIWRHRTQASPELGLQDIARIGE